MLGYRPSRRLERLESESEPLEQGEKDLVSELSTESSPSDENSPASDGIGNMSLKPRLRPTKSKSWGDILSYTQGLGDIGACWSL